MSLRAALHDLESDPKGYVPDSQLEMIHLVLRHADGEKSPYLEKFTLIDVVSLFPWDPWVRSPSWRFSMALDQAKDLGRKPGDASVFRATAGVGGAAHVPLPGKATIYCLTEFDGEVGGVLRDNYRLGAGERVGLLWQPLRFWRIHVNGGFWRYPAGDVRSTTRYQMIQSFSLTKLTEFRVNGLRDGAPKKLWRRGTSFFNGRKRFLEESRHSFVVFVSGRGFCSPNVSRWDDPQGFRFAGFLKQDPGHFHRMISSLSPWMNRIGRGAIRPMNLTGSYFPFTKNVG